MGVITQAIRNRINQDLSQGLGKTDVNIERLEYYLRGIEALVEGGGGGGGVNSVLGSWVDNTDPVNPIVNVPFSNWIATANPTVSDDDTVGYIVGSTWINTTTGQLFTATDVTTGAAVWVKGALTAPITLAFADVATETSAGNLIDGQMYNITGFPAFLSGIQLVNLEFRAHLVTAAGYAVLSMEGVAYDSGTNLQIGLTVDWYTSGSPAIGVVVPYLWNELRRTDNVAFGNEIDMLKWNDATKVYRSTINDLQISNFDEVADSLVITNSFIQSGSSIDMAGFTGLVLDHVNLGFACDIIVTADSITCQDIRTGSNNTIYLPANGINGGIWGSNNTIGGVSLGFSQFDNITMGNDNDITPDIDGIWSIQNCEWGDRKTHVINSSFDGCFWIGNQSTFVYVSDMSVDVDIAGNWAIPVGYGIITMGGGAAPASIAAINNQIPIRCLNSGVSNVFSNASGLIFETVPVNTAGALAVGSTVTSLTTGVNYSDSFDVVKDSNGTDTIIKNITLTP